VQFNPLDTATHSWALAVSADGSLIVGQTTTQVPHIVQPYLWSSSSAISLLTTPPPPGGEPVEVEATGAGMTPDGSVVFVGGFDETTAAIRRIYRWTAASGLSPIGEMPVGAKLQTRWPVAAGGSEALIPTYEDSYLWTARSGFQEVVALLQDGGVNLGSAQRVAAIDLSADGQTLLGTGKFEYSPGQFRWESWVARLPAGIACYANCDGSTAAPLLTVNDFQCFLSHFVAGDSYANCDMSVMPPTLNINDFQCFLNKFAGGC
jgi:hypothetical protein